MCLRLRKTASRGREPTPSRWRRIRSWRLRLAAPRLATCVMSPRFLLLAADLAGLAGLAANSLPGVPNALALVWLGLAGRPDASSHLANELLVYADDGQPRRVL